MNFYQDERIVLLIDGPSLHMTARALGFEVDYKELLSVFQKKGKLLRALYYTTILEQQDFTAVRPLVDWLEYNGYTLITKPAKEFTDAAGRRRVKGDMDVELAVHAMQMADTVDHIVIFTGDGDFRCLVEALQQRGKRVSVISTLETQPAMVADELRRQADQFIDLASLESLISRKNPAGRRPPIRRMPEPEQHADFEDRDGQADRQADRQVDLDVDRSAKPEATDSKPLTIERSRPRQRIAPK